MNRWLKGGTVLVLGSITFFYGDWYIQNFYYIPCAFPFNTNPLPYLYLPLFIYLIPCVLWGIGFYLLTEKDEAHKKDYRPHGITDHTVEGE